MKPWDFVQFFNEINLSPLGFNYLKFLHLDTNGYTNENETKSQLFC